MCQARAETRMLTPNGISKSQILQGTNTYCNRSANVFHKQPDMNGLGLYYIRHQVNTNRKLNKAECCLTVLRWILHSPSSSWQLWSSLESMASAASFYFLPLHLGCVCFVSYLPFILQRHWPLNFGTIYFQLRACSKTG